jgi:hypothetical protein
MSGIPTPDSVTPVWLTDQLRRAGHPKVEVRGFTSKDVGTGQIGRCIRYTLDLAGEKSGAPRSLVGKFPSDDPKSRETGVQLRNYLKEVSFYRELVGRLEVRAPRCYYAEIEGEGPHFALLLEDLAPALQGDQLRGCGESEARAAVLGLVGLQAPSWCDASLRGIDWLGEPSEATVQIGRTLYGGQLPSFLDRLGAALSADEAGIIERVAESKGPPFELLDDVFSLVHVDYRLDNLLFDARHEPPSVAVVDWQSITLGRPLSDVGYFMGAGLLPELRREVEGDIVRDYHAALERAGIEGYSFDRCWHDYRRGTFAGFAVTVIAATLVQQTERGDEMFIAMARRHARHALDLGAEEFLGA